MSQENVEIVRRWSAAFNRGDRAAAWADCHPDIEYRDLQHAPDSPERLHGRVALEAYWAQWEDAFDELSVEIEEYIDAGDCVVTVTHWRGSGKDTAIQVDVTGAGVWEFAGGKIIRATIGYADKHFALKAVGESSMGAAGFEPATSRV